MIQIGTEGAVEPGMRCGLPDHIDGVPVAATVPVLTLPLPMIEIREDDDGGRPVPARWPDPFDHHDLNNSGD
jgi:hypothetical protein